MTSYDGTPNLPEQTFQGKRIQYTAIYDLIQLRILCRHIKAKAIVLAICQALATKCRKP